MQGQNRVISTLNPFTKFQNIKLNLNFSNPWQKDYSSICKQI